MPPSGSPPTLPPSALSRLQANALTDRVAVRILNAPTGLRDNAGPLKINGVVTGQNQDGSLTIRTDKGDVQIALRDRGQLPVGTQLDIDIPAGRSPQQATIAVNRGPTSDPAPATPPKRDESITLTNELNKLEINKNLSSESLDTVLRDASSRATTKASQVTPKVPIEPDQLLRLNPSSLNIPRNAAPTTDAAAAAQTLKTLLEKLEGLPVGQQKTLIGNILSQLLANTVGTSAPSELINNIRKILQIIDNKQIIGIKNGAEPSGIAGENIVATLPPPTGASNTSTKPPILLTSLQTPSLLNFAKPLDARIIGVLPNTLATGPAALLGGEGFGLSTALPDTGKPIFIGHYVGIFPLPAAGTPAPSLAAGIVAATGETTPTPNTVTLALIPAQIPAQSTPAGAPPPLPQQTAPQPILAVITNLPSPTNAGSPAPLQVNYFALPVVPTNLPVGSTLLLALQPAAGTNTGATLTPSLSTPSLTADLGETPIETLKNWLGTGAAQTGAFDTTWDSLNDMGTLLSHTAATTGGVTSAANLLQMLPSVAAPHNAGPLALFFLSLIRSGDMDNWMNPQVAAALRQNARGLELLRTLSAETHLLHQTENMPVTQDWRMMTLPFAFGQHIQKTPIYYKHLPQDDAEKDARDRKSRRLRFLFDLNLNRMGGVQVDGFMQSETAQSKKLDIILRTKTSLSVPMQGQMRQIYAHAMERSHLTGELSFQFRPEQWVVLDRTATATPSPDNLLV